MSPWSNALTVGKASPMQRAGGVAAAAEEVDAEHPVAVRVERAARADALVPPTGPLAGKPEHVPAGRDAAEDGDDRRPAPTSASRYATRTSTRLPPKCEREGPGQANDSRRAFVALGQAGARRGGVGLLWLGRHRANVLHVCAHAGHDQAPRPRGNDARRLPRPTPPGLKPGQPRGNSSVGGRVPVELAPFRAGWARRLPRLQRAIPSAGLDECAEV